MPLTEKDGRIELSVSFALEHQAVAQAFHALIYDVLGVLEWYRDTNTVANIVRNTAIYIRSVLDNGQDRAK